MSSSTPKKRPFRSEALSKEALKEKLQRMDFLVGEERRRTVQLEPMYYGLPDLLFPRGQTAGQFDLSTNRIIREPLGYEETELQYQQRQNKAIYDLVTTHLFVVKDDKFIRIKLIPKMAQILGDLFYGRVSKLILWANRGGGKSLMAAVFMWISFVYKKKSCLNMGGAGNQARRVYDYTKQFWHNFPGMQDGMLTREPLLQSTEMKNSSKLVCATSASTAIGEHVGIFVADEASILPGTLLSLEAGFTPIEDVVEGDMVVGRSGELQKTLERFSHPYNGRVLRLRPYGSSVPCWVTEEHRVWAIPHVEVAKQKGQKKRKCPRAVDVEGREPEWVRAWDLKVGDVLCYPRFKQEPNTAFALCVDQDRMVGGERFWRFLGYWVGDGSASGSSKARGRNYPIKIHAGEDKRFFVEDVAELLTWVSTGSVTVSQWPSRGKCIDIRSSSDKALWSVLRGRVGIGQERGVPHEWITSASDDELMHFLRGYLRTDGNPVFSKTGALCNWALTTTAPGLAQNALYALNRLGISFRVGQRASERYGVENRDRWDIAVNPAGAERILTEEDLDGIRMPGKQGASPPRVWYDDDWCYAVIKEIEEDWYEGEVYDLKMDGDPSFGTPACTMLHNCTDRPGADHDLMRAMQGALSEEGHTIFLLSTFHLPTGFFADVWDSAEDMGFTKVIWNCSETMKACNEGLEHATDDDPGAVESFCKTECPLSWEIDTKDEFGNVNGSEWVGCLGTARTSDGWQSRETVLEEQRINIGTRIFPVEHMCIRPQGEGAIYNRSLIEACLAESFNLCTDRPLTVGIDWGLTQCAIVLIGEWKDELENEPGFFDEGVGLVDIVYMSNRLVDAVVEQIQRWQLHFQIDHVLIRADASHPYCNKELADHGYHVRPVKGDRHLMGEDNVARWLGSGQFKILSGFALFLQQMHNLRRNILTGKQRKVNKDTEEGDHGPDALKFALMNYDYVRWTKARQKAYAEHTEKKDKRPVAGKRKHQGLNGLLYS